MPTKIEWTDETWNPVTGCTPVSAGCANCYARRMARRLAGRHGYPEAPNHFDVTLRTDRLDQPFGWEKPRMVFTCSMSDLFHNDVPTDFIRSVFKVIAANPAHTFQILTKRPKRMNELCGFWWGWEFARGHIDNAWLGVTVENQTTANERIPLLLQISAAVRFMSVEPMLEAIDIREILASGTLAQVNGPYTSDDLLNSQYIDWIICGAETGPGKRPMNLDWARDLRDQCVAAGVPFFFKKDSLGNRTLDGRLWEEYPDGSS
jgi:protein gp37